MSPFKPEPPPVKPEIIIVMADDTQAPVPPGHTVERVVAILREVGLEPVAVLDLVRNDLTMLEDRAA